MTALNTPQPGATVVPSAAAERRRIWRSDSFGLALYGVAEATFIILALAIVLFAR